MTHEPFVLTQSPLTCLGELIGTAWFLKAGNRTLRIFVLEKGARATHARLTASWRDWQRDWLDFREQRDVPSFVQLGRSTEVLRNDLASLGLSDADSETLRSGWIADEVSRAIPPSYDDDVRYYREGL